MLNTKIQMLSLFTFVAIAISPLIFNIEIKNKTTIEQKAPQSNPHSTQTCTIPMPSMASCTPPPQDTIASHCPVPDQWRLCHIPNLYISPEGTLMVDPSRFPYNLPFQIDMPHVGPVQIQPLIANDSYVASAKRVKGFHVIHTRVYPHNFAHSIRDTLSYDLYAFRRFCISTWDVALIASKLRVIYLDNEVTNSEVYTLHTDHPAERTLHAPTLRVLENAVVGHLHGCGLHFFKPVDWHAMSDFVATRLLGYLPQRIPNTVWIANREKGRDREWVDAENEITPLLEARGLRVMPLQPMYLTLQQQVYTARTASFIVGPHGSNLIPMVFAGKGTSVVEILASDFQSRWYAEQAVFQSARWISYPTDTHKSTTMGSGRVKYSASDVADYVATFIQAGDNVTIACQNADMRWDPHTRSWKMSAFFEISDQACWPQL